MSVLSTHEVKKSFPARRDAFGRPTEWVHAVKGVSIALDAGETLAVVGESGSGKSTLARLALNLITPDSGKVMFGSEEISRLGSREMRARRRDMQMIFQDPFNSLDPRMVIADQIAEPLLVHGIVKGHEERRERALELMQRVGLAEHQLDRFPYEFSGGQLQRVAIARALATDPKVLVCDEPVAALDMSIRAQVINLLRDLQDDRQIALLFITHDLSLVRLIAHRVAVMYQGELVEEGATEAVFESPRDSYTKALLSAVPIADPRQRRFVKAR